MKPHLLGVLTVLFVAAVGMAAEESWDLLLDRGNRLAVEGHYAEARATLERARAAAEQLGPADPRLAIALNNLGSVFLRLTDVSEAERCYRRSADIWEQHNDAVSALAPLTNMAAVHIARHQYSAAESLLRRALEVASEKLGSNHGTTAAIVTYLADVAFNRRDYVAAAGLGEHALAILRKTHSGADPDLAIALDNLGAVYRAQGRQQDAQRLYSEAIQVLEASGQPENPAWISALDAYGVILLAQGQWREAEERLARSLALAEKILGPNHPSVAQILRDDALALRKMKRKSEAKKMEARAAAIVTQSGRENGLAYTVELGSLSGFR
jgi:tetratricopeptide (TPR) repeat protein